MWELKGFFTTEVTEGNAEDGSNLFFISCEK
ncbi:hypothetical protein SAMN04489724_2533 [Algoriphagus locisalis]|uniref:Uncharacterized protein n=1 Tax=Algoriphagus locisalis TaxID=305507 RepID=A0A1I7BM04_9BACT|nr:hypothetical protein SAMN04489724_2533 [Algoriphagus locisalis]